MVLVLQHQRSLTAYPDDKTKIDPKILESRSPHAYMHVGLGLWCWLGWFFRDRREGYWCSENSCVLQRRELHENRDKMQMFKRELEAADYLAGVREEVGVLYVYS